MYSCILNNDVSLHTVLVNEFHFCEWSSNLHFGEISTTKLLNYGSTHHRRRNWGAGVWPSRFYNFSIEIRFLSYKTTLLSFCAPPRFECFLCFWYTWLHNIVVVSRDQSLKLGKTLSYLSVKGTRNNWLANYIAIYRKLYGTQQKLHVKCMCICSCLWLLCLKFFVNAPT